ncbi:MAG: hypothetical protein R2831_12710 [Chitinophagaceae bacterium]
MTITLKEFTRRFTYFTTSRCTHSSLWILSSTWKRQKLKNLQAQLMQVVNTKTVATKLHKCPCCKTGTMITIDVFGKRGPPQKYLLVTQSNPA